MSRRLMVVVAFAAVALLTFNGHFAGAVFSTQSDSTVTAAADRVQNWLHAYSQSTDPDGQTGYYLRRGTTTPAATGTDATLAADLGSFPHNNSQRTVRRLFSLKPPTSFPVGVTSITVTLSVQADPTTGFQPFTRWGMANFGTAGVYNTTVTLTTAGPKQQVNLRMRLGGATSGVTYVPRVLVTVTYTGVTVTYYQYSVPVSVTVQ